MSHPCHGIGFRLVGFDVAASPVCARLSRKVRSWREGEGWPGLFRWPRPRTNTAPPVHHHPGSTAVSLSIQCCSTDTVWRLKKCFLQDTEYAPASADWRRREARSNPTKRHQPQEGASNKSSTGGS